MRVFDLEQTTIEHIYPANADSANQDATLEPLKNTLGNLSFWAPGDNSGAGNRPFLEKVPLYENSSVSLNRQLANLSRWTVSELETRANELIQLAKKIYSLSDD